MRKRDIQTHELHYMGPRLPAINVKVYSFGCTAEGVARRFQCREDVARKAINFWFESAAGQFWEEAVEIARSIFPDATVNSAGRSSGWLVLSGMPALDHWDAPAVQRFARLQKEVRRLMTYLTSSDFMLEQIEANRWAEEGAEHYNFFDAKDGTVKCIAEEKRKAIQAGFGAVVRP